MRTGWKTARLEDVCNEITDGSHFSPKTVEEGFPYVTVRDIENDQVDFDDCKSISKPDFVQLLKNGCKPNKGDILFSKDGTVGKVALIDFERDFVVLSSLAIVRPDRTRVDPKFLKYVLKSPIFLEEAIGRKSGVAIRRIILRNLKSIYVPVPPLPEQQRIACILDKAFDGIATARDNTGKNLQNVHALFQSRLESVFTRRGEGWVEKRLSDVSKDFGRGKSKHRPRNDPKLYGGKYPFIQTGDVRNSDHLITSYSQTYNAAGLAQSKLWPAGTLCITIAANIAETGILAFDACFPDSVIGTVVDEAITSNKFLEYLLQSFKARLQAQGKGSAQDNINLGTFENQLFPFPSMKIQNAIVTTLDSLREETQRLEAIYQRKSVALDELKRSLLHQAFSGAL
jgi:type I restriction enzyme S subunit